MNAAVAEAVRELPEEPEEEALRGLLLHAALRARRSSPWPRRRCCFCPRSPEGRKNRLRERAALEAAPFGAG